MTITAPTILDKAAQHMRDRAATYDKPDGERSMAQTVAVFNTFHGTKITEAQGWHFMQILKDVRLFTTASYHADSGEDGVAYAGLKCEAKAREVVQPDLDAAYEKLAKRMSDVSFVSANIGSGFVRNESLVPGELKPHAWETAIAPQPHHPV